MSSPAVNVSTGLTIAAGTSSWSAQIIDVQWSGVAREAIETSHMATAAAGAGTFGNRTFIPGDLSDPGELTVQFHFNPDTEPPIDQLAETWTVTIPGSTTPATWACSGFATNVDVSMPLEDKMVGTMTIKLSGSVTQTAGT